MIACAMNTKFSNTAFINMSFKFLKKTMLNCFYEGMCLSGWSNYMYYLLQYFMCQRNEGSGENVHPILSIPSSLH